MTTLQSGNSGYYVVKNDQFKGHVYETPYGWFADPRNSSVRAIPCIGILDAIHTVKRLGFTNDETTAARLDTGWLGHF